MPGRGIGGEALWVAALVAGLIAFWHVRLVSGNAFPAYEAWDAFVYYLPSYHYESARLRVGSLPFWNPHQGAGQPFLAVLQPGALYPSRVLLLFVDVPTAMGLGILGHVLLGFVATWTLARSLGASAVGAAVAGVIFTAVFSMPNLYWPSYLEAGVWLPVAAWVLVRARDGRWPWIFALALAIAMPLLAGGNQVTVCVAYGLVIFFLALLVSPGRRGGLATPRVLVRLVLAGVLALATVAPQLLPTAEWTRETVRRPEPLSNAQISPWSDPMRRARSTLERGSGWTQLYLSMPAAAFGAVGFATAGSFGAVIGAGAVGTFLLVLGPGTPWFEAYRSLPGLAIFRIPDRLFILVAFFVALGAGLGVTWLAGRRGLAGPRGTPALELGALGVVAGVLLGPLHQTARVPWRVPQADLAMTPALLPTIRRLSEEGRVMMPSGSADPRLMIRQGMMQGFPVLQDHEPLSSRRLAAYVSAVAGQPAPTGSELGPFIGFVPLAAIVRPALLDLLAVRGIVNEPWAAPPARAPAYVRVVQQPGVEVYENPLALPRAFLLSSARFVADERAALDALVSGRVDGRTQAVVVGEPGPEAAPVVAAAPGALRPARCTVDDPERVVVEFTTDAPALLVLADAFAPGWRVTVDGVLRRVELVNHLVRGVFVRPGERHAEFTYHAPGFAPGAAAAALAWGGVGAAALLARRRRARQARA